MFNIYNSEREIRNRYYKAVEALYRRNYSLREIVDSFPQVDSRIILDITQLIDAKDKIRKERNREL